MSDGSWHDLLRSPFQEANRWLLLGASVPVEIVLTVGVVEQQDRGPPLTSSDLEHHGIALEWPPLVGLDEDARVRCE